MGTGVSRRLLHQQVPGPGSTTRPGPYSWQACVHVASLCTRGKLVYTWRACVHVATFCRHGVGERSADAAGNYHGSVCIQQ
eukprot:6863590-Pyramimonas_sp.AAC.1